MRSTFCTTCLWLLPALILLTNGCKKNPGQSKSDDYFQTSFQSESQFIVETIVADLTEQIYYATKKRLPDTKSFSVSATESAGSSIDAPIYDLRLKVEEGRPPLELELNVDGPIWSPEVYRNVAVSIADEIGLRHGATIGKEDGNTKLVLDMTDLLPESIERNNQQLSAELEADFTNPVLHEKAALLLGSFALRERSGFFHEIRSQLSRMTTHLTMARLLSQGDDGGIHGQIAEGMLLTLMGNQAAAVAHLQSIDATTTAVEDMVRALKVRNTGDYRVIAGEGNLSAIEEMVSFAAMASGMDADLAWLKLSATQKRTVDYVREVGNHSYSVQTGHELLRSAIALEIQEIQSIYEMVHQKELQPNALIEALNELPERCISPGNDRPRLHVIGWGHWAGFLQRHLCHAVQQNFHFMYRKWGVRDEAQVFAARCNVEFGALRLYPFVRRFNCTDEAAYHSSVDDGFKVTAETPHLVPAECWNYLCYRPNFTSLYSPNPNPHVNEWHSHNPPPGTVYDIRPRLDHPSLIHRADVVARLDELHALAPYNARIASYISRNKYGGSPTPDQVKQLYAALLPYSMYALQAVANTVRDQPAEYEKHMLQAAELDAGRYYELSEYALEHNEAAKAADYLERACEADPDAVRVSNHAEQRVRYHLKNGDIEKAREIADFAAEVYSFRGLRAKAVFLEEIKNYQAAFDWYVKIEERYNDSSPLIAFCRRHQLLTGSSRFEPEVRKRVKTIFPEGMQKTSLSDFTEPPSDGVLIDEQNSRLRSYGLKQGDIIVALDGIRVHNMDQYTCIRESLVTDELNLVVWQGDGYREIRADPPRRLFGARFVSYGN